MIDSQMDDMIREKLALKEQIDSLKQNLSKQIKEKECLLQTFTVFKSESKEKEDKYMENEIDLEKKIKELDNILFKVGQSAQTVHMLTKPHAFYDNIHKQALGYQNPFYLRKAQRIKPTLYDGIVMSDKHVAMPVIDDEETLILEEKSRSKMSEKAKDPEIIDKNISHKPIDYEKLNRLSEDFGKRFTPQQEMDAEQAFWLRISNPTSKPSDASPVKIEAPKELPKVSLVNESLKKLKFHLARFDNVVKIRTTLDARTEELLLENDRLLQQIMSQEVLLTMMNSMSLFGESASMDGKRKETYTLEAELLKSQNTFNDLLKCHSQLEKHYISLECSIQLNQEIFQKREYCDNQNALEIPEFFAYNDLKAQLEDKEGTICKLKDIIKSMRENSKKENVKYDYYKIETKNVELEKSVAKLLSENERLCNEINHVKQEQANILQRIVEQAKEKKPLDDEIDFACKNAQLIQELLVYVRDTCPNAINLSTKKVAITPKKKVKKVRFAEPLTSSSNSKQVESSKTSDSNTPVLSSIRLKCSTSKSGSKPTGNKRNDRISQTPSRNMKNKLDANSDLNCATCKKSLLDDVHDKCLLDFVKNVTSHAKSAKKHKKQTIWKPMGHVFTEVGFKWKLTGRTFTIVGNLCPSTRITLANVVPPKTTNSHSVESKKPELKVYSRKLINVNNVGSSKKAKIVESKNANHSKPNHTRGSNATDIPLSSSLFMTGCLDCSLLDSGMTILQELWGIVIISWETLLSQGYTTSRGLDITCVDLLFGSRDTNLYTISLDDMLKTSPICLLSKASKIKSWLWHRRLSNLNFGKSKKSSHQPKAEDTNQEKLYLLHMDLCSLMRVASINGKRYILVIVDDYSRFTWVRFLKTKDEAPEAIIKCIKNIQVRLNATVRNVQTDNGTEFVNQTLREFYENVGISHQTSVARTPQQNDVVERRNRTLIEAARTMLIFSIAPLFLWAKAINTTCYTQNHSIIYRRYNKTPYELMQDKKPDLSFFHVFGALCYPTNDSDDLGKLDERVEIDIFVGYAPAKKAFRIYNKRTHKIIETIHVTFDELTIIASKQFSLGPGLQCMTPATSSSGLVSNTILQHPFQEVTAPRAVDLVDSTVSTSIDQDATSSSTPSTQEQE
ncbi:retrovirus-related pol polyprotein from transposon TNT 1-94 [Tanacetum coccineum]